MSSGRERTEWETVRPPCFALIRGPIPGSGFEVATLGNAGSREPTVALLFSTREKAQDYLARRPEGPGQFRVGVLPTWKKLVYFLEHLTSTVRYLCLDVRREQDAADVLVPLESLLPAMRRKARAEVPGGMPPEAN